MKGLGPYQKPTFLSLILVSFFLYNLVPNAIWTFLGLFLSLFMSLAGLWPPQLLVVSSWNIYRREQSWCTHPLQCPKFSYTPLVMPLILQSYICFSQLFQTWCIHPLQCSNAQCAFCQVGWPCGQKLKSKNTLSDGKKIFLRPFFLCCFRKKTLKLVSLFIFRH